MHAEILRASLGKYEQSVKSAIAEAGKADVLHRIWAEDATLWKSEEEHQRIIKNSLGWLTVPGEMLQVVSELNAFAQAVRGPLGFRQVMVCGMGGSSLCPEVLKQTFGHQSGYPELLVLDSTDPDVLVALGKHVELEKCLFIIASKSGSTTEPLVFHKYWYDQVRRIKSNPGENFVAITDPGTAMVRMAENDHFRRIFLNQPDIGGRYSALSYFGMVPAALMGVDAERFLKRAHARAELLRPSTGPDDNPGLKLGVVMAECARAGRDKLTLIADQKLAAIGLWIEQLVAESTGKEGKGIIPVSAEPLGRPSVYGNDRLFVSIAINNPDNQTSAALKDLELAGHPVVYLTLSDVYELGAHFFLWEFATAVAGWRLGINSFDQPNVQESKDATKELLEFFKREGKLPEQKVVAQGDGLTVYADEETAASLPSTSVVDALRGHLARIKPGDYIALLDYFEESPEIEASIQDIRNYLRASTKCATTTGYGPRFLHSTGQLHKGGPDSGVFLQNTAADATDLPIPGEPYTFSILKQAQALGDFRSLAKRGRRAIRVQLGSDVPAGLKLLRETIIAALED